MEPVVGEHDLVLVAAELGNVLGSLLEPGSDRLAVEARGRQLDHAEALALELVEQRPEQRVGDDRDPACARVAHLRSAPTRSSSSSGS